MQTSIFIAKFLGVAYVIFGLGLLLNPKYYKKMLSDLMKSTSSIYYGGIMALVAGFLITYYHNLWCTNWAVVITVLGWMGLLKGFLLIVLPNVMVSWTKSWTKNMSFIPLWGSIVLLMGLYLIYFGFFA